MSSETVTYTICNADGLAWTGHGNSGESDITLEPLQSDPPQAHRWQFERITDQGD